MDPSILIDGVSLAYPTTQGPLEALKDVDLSVAPREFTAVVGPSGCGKTSLLRIIAGLVMPTRGDVRVLGTKPAIARQQHTFSFVFQHLALLPWRTVLGNVALPGEIVGRASRSPAESLALVGLRDSHHLYPHQLSGGMQQRVALARALTIDPKILLLDEPFGALDELTRESLNIELARLCEAVAVTAVLVTHSVSEAVFLADRVVVMSSRPGRPQKTFPVPFGRPRAASLFASQPFVQLTQEIRRELR